MMIGIDDSAPANRAGMDKLVTQPSKTFPSTLRMSGKHAFAGVYDGRVRETRGPLTVYAKPNGLSHSRIGLSISRRVGTAPRRNRIKRLLRESFRLMQHELPQGYDWIIIARPHEPLALGEYQKILLELVQRLDATWMKRRGNP
jgi:ribonuclease P protein component